MKLLDLLDQEAILPELTGTRKKEILSELCETVARTKGLEKEPLLEVLLDRERLGSTGYR